MNETDMEMREVEAKKEKENLLRRIGFLEEDIEGLLDRIRDLEGTVKNLASKAGVDFPPKKE